MTPITHAAVDCDTHFYEPAQLWQDYIDPSFRDRAPRLVNEGGRVLAQIGDELYPSGPKHPGLGMVYGPEDTLRDDIRSQRDESVSVPGRLDVMERTGTSVHVIYPTLGMVGFGSIEDAALAGACARAYNRFAADYASEAPERLKPVMMVPVKHPEHAVAELRHGREELGLDIAFVNPTPPDGRSWSDPYFDDVWSAVEDLDVTFTYHEAAVAAGKHTVGFERYGALPMVNYLCTHTIEPMLAITDMTFGGVFERHPSLRVGLLEAHLAWVAGWLDLLDFKAGALKAHEQRLQLSMSPSDYFRRHVFVAAFPDDPGVDEVMDRVGEENVVFASDWPHTGLVPSPDADHPVEEFLGRNDVSEERKRKVLSDNPRRWLRLETAALEPAPEG